MARRAFHNGGSGGDLPPRAPRDAVKMDFARRLQRRMTELGLNQSETARRAAMHTPDGKFGRDNVSNYVRGIVLAGPVHLAALAKALECTPDDLLPSRGVPKVDDRSPPFSMRDAGDGMAWLAVNQAVPWSIALQVAQLLNPPK
jgi:transcriptional regulator with XRE-family HTH domain